jgi:hypothetical protein
VLLLIHLAATLYMAGVIWFVQLVHYPLFAMTGAEGFAAYAGAHQQRTGWVVMLPMMVELGSAALLLWMPPARVPYAAVVAGLLLAVGIWASTFLWQVPEHARLSTGFDAAAIHRLVSTNWIRTVGWTLRAGLALWFVARQMR